MTEYAQYDKMCGNIIAANEVLLDEFEVWLKATEVSQKTIDKHCENVGFYLNTFLLCDLAIEAKDGANSIGMFLGYWFIRKAMWASQASIKSNAVSLKKFYTFMYEKGLIDQNDLSDLKQMIKDGMPEWLATLKRYQDPSIIDPWD